MSTTLVPKKVGTRYQRAIAKSAAKPNRESALEQAKTAPLDVNVEISEAANQRNV
jgi:hypothetical protein